MPSSLSISAWAKVNLCLGVAPPLPPTSPTPGFHPIASWMACIDLADDLLLHPRTQTAGPSTYRIEWAPDAPRPTPIDWPLEKDLAVRAHRLLEQWAGRPLPIDMAVRKRIPVGGGLGGGSSDAAASLLGVRQLFNLSISPNDLRALASKLGSDVAFFLDDPSIAHAQTPSPTSPPPRPAIVAGLGDRLSRVAPVAADLILVVPPFGCPTGPVYKAFDALPADATAGADELRVARVVQASAHAPIRTSNLFNDLAEPAFRVQPALRTLRDSLAHATGTPWHVTGSGSCLFALSESENPTLLDRTRRAIPANVVVWPTRLLNPA